MADSQDARFAHVEMFDNVRAARMRRLAFPERLSEAELRFHDQHKIGFYDKNTNTGYHELRIVLSGVGSASPWILV